MIRFTKRQVEAREYERLDPARYDFRWNRDFTECEAVPLLWWDDASYAAHQGDSGDDYEPDDGRVGPDAMTTADAGLAAPADDQIPF